MLNLKTLPMFVKIKNRPLWYKLWATSVAISAIYFLVKYFFFELAPFDRFIEVYALFSLLFDFLLFPKEQVEKNEKSPRSVLEHYSKL